MLGHVGFFCARLRVAAYRAIFDWSRAATSSRSKMDVMKATARRPALHLRIHDQFGRHLKKTRNYFRAAEGLAITACSQGSETASPTRSTACDSNVGTSDIGESSQCLGALNRLIWSRSLNDQIAELREERCLSRNAKSSLFHDYDAVFNPSCSPRFVLEPPTVGSGVGGFASVQMQTQFLSSGNELLEFFKKEPRPKATGPQHVRVHFSFLQQAR